MNRIETAISDAELARRWQAVRAAMAAQSLDALVMQNNNDWLGGYVKWFTDLPANNAYPVSVLFLADGPMVVVEMGGFGGQRAVAADDPVLRGVGELRTTPAFLSASYTNGYAGDLIAEAIRARGLRRVGLVGRGGMPAGFVDALSATLDGKATLGDATQLIDTIKAVKSPEEVTLLHRAAQMQDQILAKVLQEIRPGMRDVEVTALAQYHGQLMGSEQGIFLAGSAPLGQPARLLGRHMQGRVLEPGDHMVLLIENNGPGGHYTEIGRTIVLGKASAELLDAFDAMKEAQAHTLGLLKPGVPAAEIARAHDTYMVSQGFAPEIRLYAHGQGYDMVERPLLRADETMALAEGMCLAVHPGIETARCFGMICDNYMLGADGVGPCMHKTPKQIFELG